MPSLPSSGPDLRRWKRFPVDVPVRLVVHRPAKVDSIAGSGTALNEGGMCVAAGIEMQPGEQVTVEFTPPSTNDHLRLWAAVRNRHDNYYGLEFLAENMGERTEVERYRNDLRAAMLDN
jgi:PilZ domain